MMHPMEHWVAGHLWYSWIDDENTFRAMPAIAGGKGETRTTTVVAQPAKSQEELALIRKQNEVLDFQLQEMRRQNEALAAVFPQQQALLVAQTTFAQQFVESQRRALQAAEELRPLEQELLKRALTELEGTPEERELRETLTKRALALARGEAPPLLPGQEEQIAKVFGQARKTGTAALETFGEEMAAARGLRVTDVPIGGELLRQKAELETGLGAAEAGAKLDFAGRQQQFDESVRQFQLGLRQRAMENRLALVGRTTSPQGVSMPTMFGTTQAQEVFGNISTRLGQLGAERSAAAGTTTTTRQPFSWLSLADPLAILGGAAIGKYSSAKYKRALEPFDRDEYESALRKIRETPILRYRYKWEPDRGPKHLGPILELAPPEISDDGETVNLLDYAGLQHAALKAVDRRVTRVARGLQMIAEAR